MQQLSILEFKMPFEAKLDENNWGVGSRPSLLVSIRKRIDLDVFESLTDDLIRKGLKLKSGAKPDDVSTEVKSRIMMTNPIRILGTRGSFKWMRLLCDAYIKYPTDLDLLNESRQKTEELIDELCLMLGVQDKPRTYRRVDRKDFLNVSKMKRKPTNLLRKAIRKQINYLKQDIRIINENLDTIQDEPIPFDRRQLKYFLLSNTCWNSRRQCTRRGYIK